MATAQWQPFCSLGEGSQGNCNVNCAARKLNTKLFVNATSLVIVFVRIIRKHIKFIVIKKSN